MTVPDYQSLMLPLLKAIGDGQEHVLMGDVAESVAQAVSLSSSDRSELLPSGNQATYDNRLGWARTYMKKAGLLDSAGRGKVCITQRGLEVLGQNPARIDVKFLERFPEFLEFRRRGSQEHTAGEVEAEAVTSSSRTPAEVLEDSYSFLRRELADELLEKVKSASPQFFEKLVVDLLIAMGYGGSRRDAGEAIGRSNDGGIDGVIKEDRLGLDAVYIQAKRWDSTVGRPVVQAFVGSLEGQKARKGVLLTTSRFSADAIDYAQRVEKKVVLIDGEHLAQLMIDFGVGVAEVATYTIKKIDLDYFS